MKTTPFLALLLPGLLVLYLSETVTAQNHVRTLHRMNSEPRHHEGHSHIDDISRTSGHNDLDKDKGRHLHDHHHHERHSKMSSKSSSKKYKKGLSRKGTKSSKSHKKSKSKSHKKSLSKKHSHRDWEDSRSESSSGSRSSWSYSDRSESSSSSSTRSSTSTTSEDVPQTAASSNQVEKDVISPSKTMESEDFHDATTLDESLSVDDSDGDDNALKVEAMEKIITKMEEDKK